MVAEILFIADNLYKQLRTRLGRTEGIHTATETSLNIKIIDAPSMALLFSIKPMTIILIRPCG